MHFENMIININPFLTCFINVHFDYKLTNMHHIAFISLFRLKLCNPNKWMFYMQFKYINLKFRTKYFFNGFLKLFLINAFYYIYTADTVYCEPQCQS